MLLIFIFFFIIIYFFYIFLYKSKIDQIQKKIITPDQAIEELVQGNKAYHSFWNFITGTNRKSVATVQNPFAIVLSCSDSRVPTEIIFNQLGLGNLFIVRNAGNIADGVALGSIEYGIDQLQALLILVLGHERCGAVTATIDSVLTQNVNKSGHIQDIINRITPAANTILNKYNTTNFDETTKIDIINACVKENIHHVIATLYQESKIIADALDSQKIKIVGAYYDLQDGNIHIITK
ncbi:MAG: carbonic anhydrase [Candidatus Chromulinivorax sp.]